MNAQTIVAAMDRVTEKVAVLSSFSDFLQAIEALPKFADEQLSAFEAAGSVTNDFDLVFRAFVQLNNRFSSSIGEKIGRKAFGTSHSFHLLAPYLGLNPGEITSPVVPSALSPDSELVLADALGTFHLHVMLMRFLSVKGLTDDQKRIVVNSYASTVLFSRPEMALLMSESAQVVGKSLVVGRKTTSSDFTDPEAAAERLKLVFIDLNTAFVNVFNRFTPSLINELFSEFPKTEGSRMALRRLVVFFTDDRVLSHPESDYFDFDDKYSFASFLALLMDAGDLGEFENGGFLWATARLHGDRRKFIIRFPQAYDCFSEVDTPKRFDEYRASPFEFILAHAGEVERSRRIVGARTCMRRLQHLEQTLTTDAELREAVAVLRTSTSDAARKAAIKTALYYALAQIANIPEPLKKLLLLKFLVDFLGDTANDTLKTLKARRSSRSQ